MSLERHSQFKNKGKDSESLRRQRSEVTVDLRKKKKDDQLFKRRNVNSGELEDDNNVAAFDITEQDQDSMNELVEGIMSTDVSLQLKYTQETRKILSRERDPPIDVIVNLGITKRLVEFLSCDEQPSLQMEAAWALTNIASGTSSQTMSVANAGALSAFINLLSSPHENLIDQSVWALGNIAGDGPNLRDAVLRAGIIQPLLKLIQPNTPITLLRNVTWTMSNLCRNKNPSPPFDAVKQLLPYLKRLLYYGDLEVVTDACWAFSYITDGTDDKISEVVKLDVVPQIVELIMSNIDNLITPALRTIGNIVTGTDDQTQLVIDSGVLLAFSRLLMHQKSSVQKEAAWTISNILAGNLHQIQSIIDASLLCPLRELLDKGEFRAQKEVAWALTNMTSGGTHEQIMLLVDNKFIRPLCNLLTVQETKTVLITLDSIYNILKAAKKAGKESHVCFKIEECHGLDKIEQLQEHENHNVYSAAFKIIEEFFNTEELETGNEEINQNGFQFEMTNGKTNFNF